MTITAKIQTTTPGTTLTGWVTRSCRSYPYLVPATFRAVARQKDGVLTWRTSPGDTNPRTRCGWIRCGTKAAAAVAGVFLTHGSECI